MRAIIILIVAVIGSILIAVENPESDGLDIEQFEKMSDFAGETINSGFVFINGKYINAPYKLEIKKVIKKEQHDNYFGGGIIYVNSIIVTKNLMNKYPDYKGDIDPDIPKDIDKNTSIYDFKIEDYFRRKTAYVQKHHTQNEEIKIMEKVYKSLPNIKSAELLDSNTLKIETYSGDIINCSLSAPRRKTLSFPRYYQQTIDWANRYANVLKSGGLLSFNERSGQLSISEPQNALKLVTALNSASTPEDRASFANGMISRDNPLVTQFKGSVQLEERVQNLNHINLTLEKLIDDKDDSFVFILENGSSNAFKTNPFKVNLNNLYKYYGSEKKMCLGEQMKGAPVIDVSPLKKIIWNDRINELHGKSPSDWENDFAAFYWFLSDNSRLIVLKEHVYLWKTNEKNLNVDFSSQYDQKDSLNFKIAKLIDGKCLSFAFIVSNDTKDTVTLPGFYSIGNSLKIKFPDGKIFVYKPNSALLAPLTLPPGKSEYIKFDLQEMLTKSDGFSMENFNYGMSELSWEVELPDKTIITKQFKLLKTKNPLPPETKGSGYVIDINTPIE